MLVKRYIILSILITLFCTIIIGQSNPCETLLTKPIPIGKSIDNEKNDEYITALKKCGYDFSSFPPQLIGIAIIDLSQKGEIVTYGNLYTRLKEIENSPEYASARKNTIGLLLFKLLLFALVIAVFIFWVWTFFASKISNPPEVLDQDEK